MFIERRYAPTLRSRGAQCEKLSEQIKQPQIDKSQKETQDHEDYPDRSDTCQSSVS